MLVRSLRTLCRYPPVRNYWWGHTTAEDVKALKDIEDSKVLVQLVNKDSTDVACLDESPQRNPEKLSYLPMRIEQERNVLRDMTFKKFSITDYFSYVNRPKLPYLTDPIYYFEHKVRTSYLKLVDEQAFCQNDTMSLGPDIAASHFLCCRQCRVRFRGSTDWTEKVLGRVLQIPNAYEKGWYIEAIDAAGSKLVFEGFQNLRNLICLKHLDLSYCSNIDEWCLDRITTEYQDSLETLDLSGCKRLDWNGLECIWRMKNLKLLILNDMDHVKDLSLICLMLLDVLPNLVIQGVDYIETELLRGTEHEHLLELDDATTHLQLDEVVLPAAQTSAL